MAQVTRSQVYVVIQPKTQVTRSQVYVVLTEKAKKKPVVNFGYYTPDVTPEPIYTAVSNG